MLLSTETGATKELMPTRPAGFGDSEPALSPDGRTMAFVRRPATLSAGDIYLMSLAEGTLTKLVSAKWNIGGLDWTADGKAIVYAGGPAGGRLWRIAVSGGESSALPIGEGARSLSVARTGSRIAYSRASYDDNIWRVAGPTATKPMSPTRLIASTQEDIWPRYSPDGRSVLFVSNRSGLPELWTCDSEGRNCRTLAALGGTLTGTGEWSPDGKRVVFTRDASARSPELYIANVDEPVTRQLTNGALGSWSPDGRWIYFMLIRDDDSAPRGRQIWKIPVAGGPAVATTARGRMPKLSADGRFLYYVRGAPPNSIWRTDMTTGEETLVLDHELTIFNWVLWRQNLIYPRIDAGRTVIAQLDLASLRTTNIASLDHDVSSLLGLTVSPDGRWMLYGRQELIGSDIVLVENFR
jgi:Tol biopolymer transport system component